MWVTKAHINIQPFGVCMRNDDCTFKLDPDDRWVNTEPQNVRVNGKEIITTRSTLLCRATGMTIRPITSGQDGKFARFLLFLRDMDRMRLCWSSCGLTAGKQRKGLRRTQGIDGG